MISNELLDVLLDLPAFAEFKSELNKGKLPSEMPSQVFERIGERVKWAVDQASLKNQSLVKLLNDFQGDRKTIRNLLSEMPAGNEFDERRKKSRHALMVYAGIDQADWHEYELKKEAEQHVAEKLNLLGDWYVYRFGTGDKSHIVQRTILSLDKKDNFIKINFKSLYGFFKYARLLYSRSGSLLTFRFERLEKTLEITARIPEQYNKKITILNTILRSTLEGNPFSKPCIMVFKETPTDDNERQAIVDIIPNDEFAWKGVDKQLQLQVLTYLGSNRGGLEAVPLATPDHTGLQSFNTERSKKEYHPLFNQSIQGEWYSICLSPDKKNEVSIKQWQFSFDQTGSYLKAACNKEGPGKFSLIGDMELSKYQLTLHMHGSDNYEKVFITAKFDSVQPDRLYAITSRVGQHISFREVFIRSFECSGLQSGNMTVEAFIEAKVLDDCENVLLLDPQNNLLQWPSITEDYRIQTDRLLKYCGNYVAFIPNFYVKKGEPNSLFQITLEIDKAGRVVEKTLNEDLKTALVYQGKAVLLNNTLRLTNENTGLRRSEYLITINTHRTILEPYYLGITLDTDYKGFPCADACIIIPQQFLKFPFKPEIVTEGTNEHALLDQYVLDNIGFSIYDFFYARYRSIRRVMNNENGFDYRG